MVGLGGGMANLCTMYDIQFTFRGFFEVELKDKVEFASGLYMRL